MPSDPATNEKYTIRIGPPLLRPGLTLTVGPVSPKYAVRCMRQALAAVREFNKGESSGK